MLTITTTKPEKQENLEERQHFQTMQKTIWVLPIPFTIDGKGGKKFFIENGMPKEKQKKNNHLPDEEWDRMEK